VPNDARRSNRSDRVCDIIVSETQAEETLLRVGPWSQPDCRSPLGQDDIAGPKLIGFIARNNLPQRGSSEETTEKP
jgi:hypothetical protein